MNKLTRFIFVSVGFLVVAVLAAIVVWYYVVVVPLRQAQEKMDDWQGAAIETGTELRGQFDDVLTETEVDKTVKSTTARVASSAPIIIDTTTLTDTQQKLAKTFGFTEGEIVITETMVVCAKEKLGLIRFDELVAGDTPTFFEGIELATCFGH